jgi:hypothetical protein
MTRVLHEDDPKAQWRTTDGRIVRNLTAMEYERTYSHGAPCRDHTDDERARGLAADDEQRGGPA